MSRRIWLPWILGVINVLLLIGTALTQTVQLPDLRLAIVMTGLVAFVVNVEVPLQGNTISLGYPAGILAYLLMGNSGSPFGLLLLITIGAALGAVLQLWRRNYKSGITLSREWIERPLVVAANLVLAIYVGDRIYQLFHGQLPLANLSISDVVPLLGLLISSVGVYIGIYTLFLWWRGINLQPFFAKNAVSIGLTILVPLPMVIAAVVLFNVGAIGGFAALIISLLALSIWATDLGHSRVRYQQQLSEIQALSAVNRSIKTSLDLEALLDTIYMQVFGLIKPTDFTLALYDANQDLVTFPLVIRRLKRISVPPRKLGQSVIDHVIKTGTPLLLEENTAQNAQKLGLLTPDSGPDSWLGVPLLGSDNTLGCIAVSLENSPLRFTEREEHLLMSLATQSSMAIQNAQLYQQTQARASQLVLLNKLSSQLSGTLDPQRIFDMVLDAAVKISSATGSAVFLWWDDARTSLALVRSQGLSEQFTSDAPRPLSADLGMKVITVQNVQTDTQVEGLKRVMSNEGINAWVELPLRHGDGILGVLTMYYSIPRQFTADEVELLQTFANQAALAISNARLYGQVDEALERRVEQLSALADISKELSSTFNLEKLFKLVLERALEATRSNSGNFLLRQENRDEPRIVARKSDTPATTGELIALEAYTRASTLAQPIVDRDHLQNGMMARLSVPIVRDYDVLGVIIVETRSANAYPPDDVSFVKQLAAQAAIAIENVRMFEWMQDNRDRLQVILDSMQEAVLMFGTDGRVSLANPRVEKLLQLSPVVLMGERVQTLIERPNLRFAERIGFDKDALCAMFDALSMEEPLSGGRFSYRLDQPQVRFVDRTIVPVYNHNRRVMGLLMVFTDATEERQLAQAREDLTRMIVHDLRSPLTAISTSMKLLNEMASGDEPVAKNIARTTDVSQRALRKLLHLVNSLLDIAKMESGSMTLDLDNRPLRPLVENVVIELSPLADELAIKFDVMFTDNLPLLRIDEDKIERVLLNLVDNALKFSPYEGVIQIIVNPDPKDKQMVRVAVVDTGPGISDDSKARIFDRFEQIEGNKSHRRGTGLGLTFCKLTVEAHGGTIWIEDNPQGGSIFVFTLPTAGIGSNTDD